MGCRWEASQSDRCLDAGGARVSNIYVVVAVATSGAVAETRECIVRTWLAKSLIDPGQPALSSVVKCSDSST